MNCVEDVLADVSKTELWETGSFPSPFSPSFPLRIQGDYRPQFEPGSMVFSPVANTLTVIIILILNACSF
jgi:hypothetical protein